MRVDRGVCVCVCGGVGGQSVGGELLSDCNSVVRDRQRHFAC